MAPLTHQINRLRSERMVLQGPIRPVSLGSWSRFSESHCGYVYVGLAMDYLTSVIGTFLTNGRSGLSR